METTTHERLSINRLTNGAHLVTERIDGVKSASLSWLIPIGSVHDEPGRLGRAAMYAELLLRGAGSLSARDQADAFDVLGVDRSAAAGARYLSVSAVCQSIRLSQAMPMVADMVLRPAMAAEAIEPVRDLCVQSIRSLADEPRERAALAARARHFAPPFDRSGLGTPEGLAALDREALVEGWRRGAAPDGSIIAVAGDIDPAAVHAQLAELLEPWSGRVEAVEPGGPSPRGYAHEHDESAQVQIILVHDAPREADDDRVLERIVTAVLSGGMSGRLFTEVREKRGLCYAVSASYRPDREFGSVTAYVGTTPERAQESLDVLAAELRRISDTGITKEEFDRALVGLKSRLVFSGESTPARASALASDMSKLGRARSLEERLAEIDGVELDRVNAYLGRRSLGRLTVQTLGPKPLDFASAAG